MFYGFFKHFFNPFVLNSDVQVKWQVSVLVTLSFDIHLCIGCNCCLLLGPGKLLYQFLNLLIILSTYIIWLCYPKPHDSHSKWQHYLLSEKHQLDDLICKYYWAGKTEKDKATTRKLEVFQKLASNTIKTIMFKPPTNFLFRLQS